MDVEIAQRLIALNKSFYQNLATPFSATRRRLQPGVKRVLGDVPAGAAILDLGCGNGSVARELEKRGYTGKYIGMDFSEELLEIARQNAATSDVRRSRGLEVKLVKTDLTSNNWDKQVLDGKFDFIFAFAVLHHIPSREIRLGFLKKVGGLLAPVGKFVLSNWQFLNSPRLKERIQPWEKLGLADSQVDDGDYLLDWRSGGTGLRYVHHFDAMELAELARETGFDMVDQFVSDGRTENLALYQIWKRTPGSH